MFFIQFLVEVELVCAKACSQDEREKNLKDLLRVVKLLEAHDEGDEFTPKQELQFLNMIFDNVVQKKFQKKDSPIRLQEVNNTL